MDRKRWKAVLLAIPFSIMLGSCAVSNEQAAEGVQQVFSEKSREKADKQIPEGGIAAEEKSKEKITDLTEAIECILNSGERNFIGGYLLDESFLMWVSRVYGEDSILRLADAVQEQPQDVQQWYEVTGNSIHVLWTEYCRHTGFQKYMLEGVYDWECASDSQVVLDFTGDINLAEGWSTTRYMDTQPGGLEDCMSDALLQEMQSADIMMINNEFTYSTRGTPLPGKAFTFRADPRRVSELEKLGTDVVSLANNHVYDFGGEALLDTLETLEQAGIPYMGAGRNLEDAMKPVSFLVNGRKLTIVSATQIERSTNYTKEATDASPGVLKTLNPDKFIGVIQKAKAKSDYVIAFVHWGTEGTSHYGSDQVSLGEQFIDAGADVIIGGHTHCLQGFDFYNGKPIIYSLGNFWFNNQKLDTGLSQVVIHTQDNTIDFKFLPCIQQNSVTSLAEDLEEKQRILDFMQQISAPGVHVGSDGLVTELTQ